MVRVELLHLVGGQLKVEEFDVLLQVDRRRRLRRDRRVVSEDPFERHLRRRLVVGCADLLQQRVAGERAGAQRRVRLDDGAALLIDAGAGLLLVRLLCGVDSRDTSINAPPLPLPSLNPSFEPPTS